MGTCRRMMPASAGEVQASAPEPHRGVWPQTTPDSWCGEHEPVDRVETAMAGIFKGNATPILIGVLMALLLLAVTSNVLSDLWSVVWRR